MWNFDPQSFSPAGYLIEEYIQNQEQRQIGGGGTGKAATERRVTAQRAYLEGICTGLAAVGNAIRGDRYSKFGMVPMLMPHDFHPFLRKVREYHDEFLSEVDMSLKGDELIAARKAANDKFDDWCGPAFEALLYPEGMEKAELERHRQAILDGEEEPTDDDREWLEQKLADGRKTMQELQDILDGKSEKRPVADAPQA